MNARKAFVRGKLAVAAVAVVLAFAVTGLNREKNHTDGKEGATPSAALSDDSGKLLKGEGAYGDWRTDAPGVRRLITPADMPKPYATRSAQNDAHVVSRPTNEWPQVLSGFKVDQIATGLSGPRLIRTAPNGDLFIAESQKGQIRALRGIGVDGRAQTVDVFATGLNKPFGIAF